MMKIKSKKPMSDIEEVAILGRLLFCLRVIIRLPYLILKEKFSTLSVRMVETTSITFW